jgi:hypothetical protein
MAVRLVAHEMGHAMKLTHPNSGCYQVRNWESTNLMSQVISLAPIGRTCRATGWPSRAARATYLSDDQINMAREALNKDLRETGIVDGATRVGKTTEVVAGFCDFGDHVLKGFAASSLPAPRDGTVLRVRWKSALAFTAQDRIKVSVGTFDYKKNTWSESAKEIVTPHSLGEFVHQEHDVEIPILEGQFVALVLMSKRGAMVPQTHLFSDAEALSVDVVGEVPMRKREHPTINQVMSAIDSNTIYPGVTPRANPVSNALVLTTGNRWISVQTCAEWIFNYDLA